MNRKKARLKYRAVYQFPESTHNFIKERIKGFCLHVCSGSSLLGDIRLDLELQKVQKNKPGFLIGDQFHLPFQNEKFDTVICDPVWNMPYHVRHKLIYQLRDMTKYEGILIFNSLWIPKIRCMKHQDVFVGLNNMAFRNVSLISVYKKVQSQFNF